MDFNRLQDKCRGSLVGGAVGDALGYEVEFLSLKAILKKYGERGISRLATDSMGVARFSDDTQMSLFTLEGLMNGIVATQAGEISDIIPYIQEAYLNWHKTQTAIPVALPHSSLSHIKTLWDRRAPGLTCMDSLEALTEGREVKNFSKGCGGVMRVAPIGIFSAAHPDFYSSKEAALLAGQAAEITHKHIASTLASALLVLIVESCIKNEETDKLQFVSIVKEGLLSLQEYYPDNTSELKAFTRLIERAIELADSETPEKDAIMELGEGWVGDEAIAIAIFAVIRHIDSFEDCLVCAVNHDGDSDSTGAIAGNIIGAILGYSAIPTYFLQPLEIEPVIVSLADDLSSSLQFPDVDPRIKDGYIGHLPVFPPAKG